MPVIKSAKKKLRKDILREKRNNAIRIALKKALKDVKKKSCSESVKNAVKLADKAAKNNIIHKNIPAAYNVSSLALYYLHAGHAKNFLLLILPKTRYKLLRSLRMTRQPYQPLPGCTALW